MRKFIVCCLVLAFCGPSVLLARYSSEKNEPPIESYEKIGLSEFSRLVYEGVSPDQMKRILIECPAGSELPFKFSLRGDVFCFEPTQDVSFSIKLTKTCYLTHLPKLGLVFSTDMRNWRKFVDFFVGRAAMAFTVEKQIPTASFELDLNENLNRWEVPFGPNSSNGGRTRYSYQYHTDPIPYHSWTPEEADK